jgi:ribosomal 30S subunit maturation factor RimM
MDFRLRIPNGLLIRLENILNPEQVRPLIQSNLALEYVQQAPQVKHFSGGEHWDFDPEDLGGGKLVDDKMVTVGNIVRVHRRPPQDFLEFTVGARSVYLPMVPEFVKQWHAQSKSLECHLPDGLLEIYLNSENENPEDGEHGFGNQVAESASSKLSPKDHVED